MAISVLQKMKYGWKQTFFVFAIVFFAILIIEGVTGNVASGTMEFRFMPYEPKDTVQAAAALESSRELAERLQSWFRDASFTRPLEGRADITLTSRSRFLPPVSAIMPAPDIVRLRIEAENEDDIKKFAKIAADAVTERLATYPVPGVRMEVSPVSIEKAKRLRFFTILGALLLSVISSFIALLIFGDTIYQKELSRRPESRS